MYQVRGEGGIQIWFGRESVAQASKSLPMFKGHFDRKRYIFKDFSQNIGLFSQFWKKEPMFKDIFGLGIFWEKATH